MRWGGANPRLILPVDPGKEYTLTIDVHVPEQAIDAQNGLYLTVCQTTTNCGERRIAEFPAQEGAAIITAVIPPQKGDSVELAVRGKTWIVESKSFTPNDARPLSVAIRRLTMKANHASDRLFDANSGGWVETSVGTK